MPLQLCLSEDLKTSLRYSKVAIFHPVISKSKIHYCACRPCIQTQRVCYHSKFYCPPGQEQNSTFNTNENTIYMDEIHFGFIFLYTSMSDTFRTSLTKPASLLPYQILQIANFYHKFRKFISNNLHTLSSSLATGITQFSQRYKVIISKSKNSKMHIQYSIIEKSKKVKKI